MCVSSPVIIKSSQKWIRHSKLIRTIFYQIFSVHEKEMKKRKCRWVHKFSPLFYAIHENFLGTAWCIAWRLPLFEVFHLMPILTTRHRVFVLQQWNCFSLSVFVVTQAKSKRKIEQEIHHSVKSVVFITAILVRF